MVTENLKLIKTFPSEVYKIKSIEKEVMFFLQDNIPYLSFQDQFELKLIFNELLINAVIHGNKEDITKTVSLEVEILPTNLIAATITDKGLGFDYMQYFSEMDDEKNIINESGRGIRIVYSLTDHIFFNVNGNEIKFLKRVKLDG